MKIMRTHDADFESAYWAKILTNVWYFSKDAGYSFKNMDRYVIHILELENTFLHPFL